MVTSVLYPATNENVKSSALDYATRYGWRVLPTRYKVPTLARWPQRATTDESIIARWFPPSTGLGIATGKSSNVIVLDIDTHKGGRVLETLEDLIGGRVPITPTVKTGSGGLHYYFQYPGAQVTHLRNSVEKLGKGIDIRGDGGFVCAPPSPQPSGNSYLWLVRPQDAPLAKLPTSLLEMLMNFPTSVNSKAPVESTAINSTAIYLPTTQGYGWPVNSGMKVSASLRPVMSWTATQSMYNSWKVTTGIAAVKPPLHCTRLTLDQLILQQQLW